MGGAVVVSRPPDRELRALPARDPRTRCGSVLVGLEVREDHWERTPFDIARGLCDLPGALLVVEGLAEVHIRAVGREVAGLLMSIREASYHAVVAHRGS